MSIFNHTTTSNERFALLALEELYRNNIRYFLLAPGSRNAPLSIALARLQILHDDCKIFTHFDERALGFFALGCAKASAMPPVIIVTSGTAVANLFPAVVEAYQSHIGFIIISADRPFELLNCGANQAIDQIRIYGNYAHYCDIPANLYDHDMPAFLTTLNRQITYAKSSPVQINWHFSEPLYPKKEVQPYSLPTSWQSWESRKAPYLQNQQSTFKPTNHNWRLGKRILIIASKMTIPMAKRLLELASKAQILIIADITCPLRLQEHPNILTQADSLLTTLSGQTLLKKVDTLIQIGEHLTSKRLEIFTAGLTESVNRYFLTETNQYPDYQHHASTLMTQINFETLDQTLIELSNVDTDNQWTESLCKLNNELILKTRTYFASSSEHSLTESEIILYLSEHLPKDTTIFIGNSLPIRVFDSVSLPTQNWQQVYSNRGASGIDGLLATFIGIQTANQQSCGLLLIGDLSLLHDITSLSLLKYSPKPLIIITFNNNGGAIFDQLPIGNQASLAQAKRDFFQLPHNYEFSHACAMFGIHYDAVKTLSDFISKYNQACQNSYHSLIEIKIEEGKSTQTLKEFSTFLQKI